MAFLVSICAYSFLLKENNSAWQPRVTMCFAFCNRVIISMMYIFTWKCYGSARCLAMVRHVDRRKVDKIARTLPVKRELLTFNCCLFFLHTISAGCLQINI